MTQLLILMLVQPWFLVVDFGIGLDLYLGLDLYFVNNHLVFDLLIVVLYFIGWNLLFDCSCCFGIVLDLLVDFGMVVFVLLVGIIGMVVFCFVVVWIVGTFMVLGIVDLRTSLVVVEQEVGIFFAFVGLSCLVTLIDLHMASLVPLVPFPFVGLPWMVAWILISIAWLRTWFFVLLVGRCWWMVCLGTISWFLRHQRL